jgi:hypothetical protein
MDRGDLQVIGPFFLCRDKVSMDTQMPIFPDYQYYLINQKNLNNHRYLQLLDEHQFRRKEQILLHAWNDGLLQGGINNERG